MDWFIAAYLAGVVITLFCGGFWWTKLGRAGQWFLPTVASAWPFVIATAALGAILYIPVWLGKKVRRWARGRAR